MPIHVFNTFGNPSAIAGTTQAFGVNDTGQIVGRLQNATGFHGFLLSGGTYTILDDPSATNGTDVRGINALGQIVGTYNNATGQHGFVLTGGTYTTIDDPLATLDTTTPGSLNIRGPLP